MRDAVASAPPGSGSRSARIRPTPIPRTSGGSRWRSTPASSPPTVAAQLAALARGGRRRPLRQAARRALPRRHAPTRRRPDAVVAASSALGDRSAARCRPRVCGGEIARAARSRRAALRARGVPGSRVPRRRLARAPRRSRARCSTTPTRSPLARVRLAREGVVDGRRRHGRRCGCGIPVPPRRLAATRSPWPAPCAPRSTRTASRCARRGERALRAADGRPRAPARGRRRSRTCSRCTRGSTRRGRTGVIDLVPGRAHGARARRPGTRCRSRSAGSGRRRRRRRRIRARGEPGRSSSSTSRTTAPTSPRPPRCSG